MEQRRNLIVGAFVVAMLVALILWVAVLKGRTGATEPYYSHYDNVTGVSPGTQVFLEGYRVGLVDSVEPSRNSDRRFRVDLSIAQDWAIPVDSVAEITASGLLSAIIIDIRAGSSPESVMPGGEIAGKVPQNLVAAFSDAADVVIGLVDDVAPLLNDVAPLLSSLSEQAPQILANLNASSGDIQKATQRLSQLVSQENVESVGRILGDVEGSAGNLESLSADLRGTRENLDTLLLSLNELVEKNDGNVSQVVVDLREMLEALSPRVDAIARNLEVTTRNLNEFSSQIRENPGVIVRGRELAGGSGQ